MLYTQSDLENSVFFKMGTKPTLAYDDLDTASRSAWDEKYHQRFSGNRTDLEPEQTYEGFAQYVAEFSHITDIAIGLIENTPKPLSKTVVYIGDNNESAILNEFTSTLNKLNALPNANFVLSGWNITNYQLPFLIKRLLANDVKLPKQMQIKGRKPWEVHHNDIMKDWQGNMFGDVEIGLVANSFGIIPVKGSTTEREINQCMDIVLKLKG